MSDYHNQAAFNARLTARRANPTPPLPLRVFYHIACMNNWQEVVTEQLRLLSFVGLHEANCCILGSDDDARWCRGKGSELGVELNIEVVKNDLTLYEGPTLNWLHQWCCENQAASVLYFHTKGVSDPSDYHKVAWRRLMQRHVIADWKANLEKLAVADILGVSWEEDPKWPHFSGNFWMARADWIAHLQAPAEYRYRFPPFRWAGHSWNRRMYVETWIGSEPYHHVESLACRNGVLWEGPQVFSFDTSMPGFTYEQAGNLRVELGGGKRPRGEGFVNVDRQPGPGVEHVCDFEELTPTGDKRLPFDDDSVAQVYSSHCFEHIRNLIGLLRETVRICKPGALVKLRVPHWNHSMALCHDHKQTIATEQVRHWSSSDPVHDAYWWDGCKKKLALRHTEYIPSGDFAEAKRLFPQMIDEQVMRFIPNACCEVIYRLEVVPR